MWTGRVALLVGSLVAAAQVLTCTGHTVDKSAVDFMAKYRFGFPDAKLRVPPGPGAAALGGSVRGGHKRSLEGGKPRLLSNVTVTQGRTTRVNVTFVDVEYSGPQDWVGLWAVPEDGSYNLFQAPIKFQFTCPACAADPTNQSLTPPNNGTLFFDLINYEQSVFFVYVHGSSQYPESIARTPDIHSKNKGIPSGGRLSLVAGDSTKMRMTWSSGPVSKPMVKFGDSQLDYQWHTPASAVDKPFEKSDMCDVNETAPAGLAGWFQPSQMNTAILEDLVPGKTYYYRYGSDEGGWSGERVFTAAPAFPSPERRTVIAAFGDMGNVELDGSLHHSWDFNDEGEVPSLNTSRALFADKDAEMVLHIGDISYACGFLSEWNNFFYQIEPVASTKAWMPGIGNHEQGFSGSYFPGTDSGGECGVPYNAYFPYASQNPDSKFQERQPWYDFTFGSVHFVVFSTEHDFTEGSPQYEWLEKTLANVDRKKTPWLVVGGHRPMYVSTEDQWRVADPILRAQLESMFAKYKVDVALWGHNHSYQRTCSIYNMTCVDGTSQHGIVHLVIGAAGYVLNPVVEGYAPMKVIDNSTYGYLHMDFQNSTVLKASFIDNSDGSVVDDFTVVRED